MLSKQAQIEQERFELAKITVRGTKKMTTPVEETNLGRALFERLMMEYEDYIRVETATMLAADLNIVDFDVRDYDF